MLEFIANNIILFIALTIIVLLIINLEIQNIVGITKKIDCDQLTKVMNQSKTILIDLRTKDEFISGHIVSAKNINLEEIDTVQIKDDATIITYGKSEADALKAAKKLATSGAKNVFYLEGGIQSWLDNNMPLSGGD